jgi:hypothetical protein
MHGEFMPDIRDSWRIHGRHGGIVESSWQAWGNPAENGGFMQPMTGPWRFLYEVMQQSWCAKCYCRGCGIHWMTMKYVPQMYNFWHEVGRRTIAESTIARVNHFGPPKTFPDINGKLQRRGLRGS